MEYLTISHCLTAPHSSNHKDATSMSPENKVRRNATKRKQRSMLNVVKKPFIHVLSDLKQDHTARAVSGSPRAVPGQFPGSSRAIPGQSRAVSGSN